MKEILSLLYWLVFNSENRMIWIKCSRPDGVLAFIRIAELMVEELPTISPWRGTSRGRGSAVGASTRE